jgi:MFS family permease
LLDAERVQGRVDDALGEPEREAGCAQRDRVVHPGERGDRGCEQRQTRHDHPAPPDPVGDVPERESGEDGARGVGEKEGRDRTQPILPGEGRHERDHRAEGDPAAADGRDQRGELRRDAQPTTARGRRPARVGQRPGDREPEQREGCGDREQRLEPGQVDDLLADRRCDGVCRQGRDSEQAEGRGHAVGRRELDGQGRGGVEACGEGEPLERAQQEQRRPDAVDPDEAGGGKRHEGKAADQEHPPADPIQQRADQEDAHQAGQPGHAHHETDGSLGATQGADVKRQEEERREGEEEEEVRQRDANELRGEQAVTRKIGARRMMVVPLCSHRPRGRARNCDASASFRGESYHRATARANRVACAAVTSPGLDRGVAAPASTAVEELCLSPRATPGYEGRFAMGRTERTYYLIFGLYSLSGWFLAPVYPLFLLSRGLDLLQINLVLATYLITASIAEVPTGAIADVVGRKTSFLLSCLVRTAAFTMYAFAGSFADCVRAEFVDALGSTLASGALEAWAVDGMCEEGDHRPTDRFFARAQMTMRLLMIAGGVACGYLAERAGLAAPWALAAAGFALTGLAAMLVMREPRRTEEVRFGHLHRAVGRTVSEGLAIVHRSSLLRRLCLLTLVSAFATAPINMYWQPRLREVTGEGAWLMGWIWALLNLSAVAGSLLVPRVAGRLRRERWLCVTALWRAATLAVFANARGASPAVLGLMGEEVGFAFGEPLLQGWMNEHVPAERRATVLSVRTMSWTLGGAIGLVVIGLAARTWGIPSALLVSASVVALTAPGYLALGRAGAAAALELDRARVADLPSAG